MEADVPRGWRLQRDFLYDPKLPRPRPRCGREEVRGLSWTASSHRADLNYIFNEMLGELSLGHTYIVGGDTPETKRSRAACSGPTSASRTAGTVSATSIRARTGTRTPRPADAARRQRQGGEYLLAVNGKDVKATDNLYKAFEATAGKPVR